MGEQREARPMPRLRTVGFPWPSAIGALAGAALLVVATEPQLAAFYALPPALQGTAAKYAVLGMIAGLVVLDLLRFRRQRREQLADLRAARDRIDGLWERNKQLQLKAHTYSEHADKLKLFISEKLLEYIEYDEKFLHFKGIAAEVRHNGVISFDKVQTALQEACAAEPHDSGRVRDYRAALEALHYLWDLLDLSTAENLTLHIGNLLCECEEQYCQRLLASEEGGELPFEPAYSPQRAAWRALAMVRNDPLPEPDGATPYTVDDGQVYVYLAPVPQLLGKENHLVLLLENLLRNAQFYASKRGYGAVFAPIALILEAREGRVCLRVYNRGPAIRDEDRSHLFQLGFSRRRKREHHGRGLGLYFVNEIVKGYEGVIEVRNVRTPAARYTLEVELQNGEAVTHAAEVECDGGRPRARTEPDTAEEVATWTLPSAVRRVSVAADGDEPSVIDGFAGKGKQDFYDPAHPARPHWRLRYRPGRHAHRLVFEPLAIDGVEFEVRLPSAQQRIEGLDAALAEPPGEGEAAGADAGDPAAAAVGDGAGEPPVSADPELSTVAGRRHGTR